MSANANLDEVCTMICGGLVQWTIVRGEHTTFPTRELDTTMKIWHHFIYARLIPTTHLTEVTHDRGLLLYGIAKNLSINVGQWINGNIKYLTHNLSLGLPYPTLLTELFVANGLDTTREEILQPKGPLNYMANH